MGGYDLAVVTKAPPKKDVPLNVRIDTALARRLKEIEAESGWSMSEIVRQLLTAGLERHDGKSQKK